MKGGDDMKKGLFILAIIMGLFLLGVSPDILIPCLMVWGAVMLLGIYIKTRKAKREGKEGKE